VIDAIVRFLLKYTTYKSADKLKEKVEGHLKYKTCKIFFNEKKEVIATVFWNIDEPDTAHITDMVFREDHRNNGMLNKMWHVLADNIKIWPVKYLKYDRDYTEDGSNRGPTRKISVLRFLRRMK